MGSDGGGYLVTALFWSLHGFSDYRSLQARGEENIPRLERSILWLKSPTPSSPITLAISCELTSKGELRNIRLGFVEMLDANRPSGAHSVAIVSLVAEDFGKADLSSPLIRVKPPKLQHCPSDNLEGRQQGIPSVCGLVRCEPHSGLQRTKANGNNRYC
jgi:hypothetical protein